MLWSSLGFLLCLTPLFICGIFVIYSFYQQEKASIYLNIVNLAWYSFCESTVLILSISLIYSFYPQENASIPCQLWDSLGALFWGIFSYPLRNCSNLLILSTRKGLYFLEHCKLSLVLFPWIYGTHFVNLINLLILSTRKCIYSLPTVRFARCSFLGNLQLSFEELQ